MASRESMSEEPQVGLGRALRFLRGQAGLTQELLAEQSGVSASWLSKIEAGRCDPTWGDMRRIASELDVSLESLAEMAEDFEGEAAA
jgi:transcriptional regulator with XRE-family HTH domain